MFLAMFSDEQKHAFLTCAHRVIAADGVVVGEERAALAAMTTEMGISNIDLDDRDETALAAVFDSRRTRVVALLELLGLAHSDHEYTLDEESFITVLAHEMGLDAAELARLDDWVQRHVTLIEEALELMRG